MNISSIHTGTPVTRLQGSKAETRTQGPQDVSQQPQDTVEISDLARYLGEIKKLPDIRQDKVDAAKAAIAKGTYETPDKIDALASRLLEELA